jgi:hypothetical protein
MFESNWEYVTTMQFTNIELHKILTLIEVGRLKWTCYQILREEEG